MEVNPNQVIRIFSDALDTRRIEEDIKSILYADDGSILYINFLIPILQTHPFPQHPSRKPINVEIPFSHVYDDIVTLRNSGEFEMEINILDAKGENAIVFYRVEGCRIKRIYPIETYFTEPTQSMDVKVSVEYRKMYKFYYKDGELIRE